MKWTVEYDEDAYKFLEKNNLIEEAEKKFAMYLKGEKVDIKKLRGEWEGYFRLRIRKLRIIFSIDKVKKRIYIEIVDYRKDVY